jgi:hypothetical protein
MNPFRQRFQKFVAPVGALSAGGLAAFLGACCGTAWLVAAIGVSGAIAVTRLAFLTPYLWLAAFGFALATLAWAYRAEPSCDIACAPAQRRRRQIAAWVVLLAMLGLFVAVRGWQSLAF